MEERHNIALPGACASAKRTTAFIRQVIPIGGAEQNVEAAANKLRSTRAADNLTVILGKFSVGDTFDINRYAHDPRSDFLNWSIIDAGAVINGLSGAAREYFKAGGIGILIGDGQLTYGAEKILETYYSVRLNTYLSLAFNYQRVNNPAYNQDRGPVSIYGIRAHSEF